MLSCINYKIIIILFIFLNNTIFMLITIVMLITIFMLITTTMINESFMFKSLYSISIEVQKQLDIFEES